MIVRRHPGIELRSAIAHGARQLNEARAAAVSSIAGAFKKLTAKFEVCRRLGRGQIFVGNDEPFDGGRVDCIRVKSANASRQQSAAAAQVKALGIF
jgi:hypothetical protein